MIDLKQASLEGLPTFIFQNNRKEFISALKRRIFNLEIDSVLLLQAGTDSNRYDTDTNSYTFIQESNFYYLTGVREPDFFCYIDLKSEEPLLFIPTPSDRDRTFTHFPTYDEITNTYFIRCMPLEKLDFSISQRNPKAIYRLSGYNSDSGLPIISAPFVPSEKYAYLKDIINDDPLIYEVLADLRTTKSINEIQVLGALVKQTVEIHKAVFKKIAPGRNERHIENEFLKLSRNSLYQREPAYSPIVGSGVNSAILHYNNNDKVLVDGDLILMDLGCKVGGYVSDITSTVPVNGKFSTKQKEIYDIVLSANRAVLSQIKPGVYWPNLQILAETIIISSLQKLGLLSTNHIPEELVQNRVASYFMPHGLGHFVGLETHDVGGYLSFTPSRPTGAGIKSLRTARYLAKGNVITVEPGLYFIEFALEQAKSNSQVSQYFNFDLLKDYYSFGGIRIEDMVLVTDNGSVLLSDNMPRRTEEIEKAMIQ